MRYEYYSSVALVSSVVVYALAMFAHAAEWASARRVPVAEAVPERQLVGAGGVPAPGPDRGHRPRQTPTPNWPAAGSSSSAGSGWC